MSKMPQWYREYLEDVSDQLRWVDRICFRRAIRQAIPALLQQGAEGETLLALLAADVYVASSPTRMDGNGVIVHEAAAHCSGRLTRSLFALTSHCMHQFPFRSRVFTTFVAEQALPLWRIHNKFRTIEIPFLPPEALKLLNMQREENNAFDPPLHEALILRVDHRDWMAATIFWSAGLAASIHWGNPVAIQNHLETAMEKAMKRGRT